MNLFVFTAISMAEFLIADLKCPTCGREFEDKAVFRAHMEFHARKKPFKCTECNYSSESQHRLDQHMHKVTGASTRRLMESSHTNI